MSLTVEEKLDKIINDLELIKNHLNIVPDRTTIIKDYDSSINSYKEFARSELSLGYTTIENQKSTIRRFLEFSNGIITQETVKNYLGSNDSSSWKSNQIKALRKYLRDYLKLGNWINEFNFTKTRTKIKDIPSDEVLAKFCAELPYQSQMIFLLMFNSGLRIGEVLQLQWSNIDMKNQMIDASNLHKGTTKSSWISFFTRQTMDYFEVYLGSNEIDQNDNDPKLFSVSSRSVQQSFKSVSENLGVSITPHLLRTAFAEKCALAEVKDKYIDAFCGRITQGVLATNYTDYSPNALRKQYDKVEPFLKLPFLES